MTSHPLSRRNFLSTTLAAATGLTLPRFASAADKPNSVFNGVRIGCITYSYRSMAKTADETLKALLEDGLSETELMGGPIQDFAGIKGKATDAEREQQLAKCAELRKMFNDAGVNIGIHKMGFGQSDEEIDFSFLVAKALGCTGVTTERNAILAKRVAPFADKHKIWVGFHNHTKNLPEMEYHDPIFELGEYIGLNLDIGHYVAGSKGKSPIPVLEKYHARITNLHLKDRTADGGNLPWGEGQTPIKEVLQLMKKEKWTFPAEIELEYKIPEGSDAVKEVAKCVQYCKEALA
ncbi:sugar phosphate isomerase/epimerase [Prosthecobacter sp.]|uniref:sugar phosphate isomerase/epimerase family protein n=1 Tax=Prosthecobacter sp. TaxID=1965333 RepID=UPI001D3989B8|nr:sugar phosphate isomerase/epimerase [Prosthecobacter sp.]MCB1279266.1 sugar phosphate isomerase/epimerase [Prosthecobacter sp.]